MSKRNLFAELQESLVDAKAHSNNQLTLKTHSIELKIPSTILPADIISIRQAHNMSRGVFARYLQTSPRTLESWEQGKSAPNCQAVTLLRLVKQYPDTLAKIAQL